MLKIGDFSKLSYISIRMLRYYDEQNILKPSYIDPETHYRFYNSKQLEVANMIQKLKSLGFKMRDIKEIVLNKDINNINHYFSIRIKELEEELKNILKASKEIENMTADNFKKVSYNVTKKVIPKRTVISLRKTVSSYMDESILWNELYEKINKEHIEVSNECYAMAIYHDLEYKEENVDIEVQVSVSNIAYNTDEIKFYTVPEIEVASVIFNGSYAKMPEVTKAAVTWMELNNYELVQPTFNIFHISPAQDNNPDNWITEACFQIKGGK